MVPPCIAQSFITYVDFFFIIIECFFRFIYIIYYIFKTDLELPCKKEKKKKMGAENSVDSENILSEIGGFGSYQVVMVSLLTILNTLAAATSFVYIISSNALDYR